MSFNVPNNSMKAAGNISPSVFVTLSDEFTVSQSGTGDAPFGVSALTTNSFNGTYAATDGQPIAVFGAAQECWLTLGGSVSAGALLKPDANGCGVTASTNDKVGAEALQAGSSGNQIRVKVLNQAKA